MSSTLSSTFRMSIILFIIFAFVVGWFLEDCLPGRGVDEYDISSRNMFKAGLKMIYVLFPTKTLVLRGTCLYDADETKHGTHLQGYCDLWDMGKPPSSNRYRG